MSTINIALVQLDARDDVPANLQQAQTLVEQAAGQGAQLVALPEVTHLRVGGERVGLYLEHAEPIPGGPIASRFADLAKRLGVHLLIGSIGETSDDPRRTYNTSVLFGPDGAMLAKYRKAHLFDVRVDASTGDRESDRYLAGDEWVVIETALGRLGLSICYDLRFPEWYRSLALAGARVVFVPANFTHKTGEAHWMALLRARAIENGVFVVAPAQCGTFPGGFEAYGHSAVIDPWGRVLHEMGDRPGVSVVPIDLDEIERVRAKVPSLEHRRPGVYRL
ncbi:MAG: carbon-nitrogen hydrolase family protein [Phycisphaeraceae bacterium]